MADNSGPADEELADLYVQDGAVEIGAHRFVVRHLGVIHRGVMERGFRVTWAALGDDEQSEAMVASHGDDILPAIAAATDVPLDKLRKMRGGVQLRLWAAVLRVNDDFFVQWADHKFGATAALVVKMINGMTPEPSITSPPEDIQSAPRTPLASSRASTARPS
jgi:hypothetical protein